MFRNVFKKDLLTFLSIMSVLNSSNATEIAYNEGAYDNPKENNVSNDLSFSKALAAAVLGGAILKEPAKDLLQGGLYSLVVRPMAKKINKLTYEEIFGKVEEAKYIKLQEGMAWCAIASFQANLKSLGIVVSQEDIYRLLHVGMKPAFFEGNRMNMTIGLTDSYVIGLPNGNALNSIAKKIDKDLIGANFLVLNEYDQNMTPELLEKIIRNIASKMKGWFCISDPITLAIAKYGHAIICKIDGEILHFENSNIPGAYSCDMKTWCKLASDAINKLSTLRKAFLFPDIIFQAFGFTFEKIKNQIIYTLTSNGGLDIYEH